MRKNLLPQKSKGQNFDMYQLLPIIERIRIIKVENFFVSV